MTGKLIIGMKFLYTKYEKYFKINKNLSVEKFTIYLK